MRLSVIFDDQLVMKDGVGYRVTLPDDPDVHAIQWTGEAGEIEYRDQHTPNEAIDDEAVLAPYLALWQAAHDAANPAPTFADRKAAKNAAVTAYRDAILNDGYTVQSGAMTGHVLQTRTTGEDRTNWLISQNAYKAAIDAGQGAVVGARFRTKANVNFTVSFSEGYAAILAMAAWGSQVVARSWALKDAVDAASDDAELDAIDITTDWPS